MIGTLHEKSLHASLKDWFAQPDDVQEVPVEGFIIDIKREDTLIEIQTRHLGAMKRKFKALLPYYPIHVIHPIARDKWIVKEEKRRKSPKRGQMADIFRELVNITPYLGHPNLYIEVALVQMEETWVNDGAGSWRRKGWSIGDKRLLDVLATQLFHMPEEWLSFLPSGLPTVFTNKELGQALGRNGRLLAPKITYTLRKIGMLDVVGKKGNAHLHQVMAGKQI